MKLIELFESTLNESVTFSVMKREGNTFHDVFAVKGEEECWVCDGTGVDPRGAHNNTTHPCEYCNGKKIIDKWDHPFQELNVANANLPAILEMLGLPVDDEYCGHWDHHQLPEIRRRLIKLMNSDIDKHTQAPTSSRGDMGISKDDDGMDRIGRRGPQMYDYGRSRHQVESYIHRLLALIDFAQKNNASVTWG